MGGRTSSCTTNSHGTGGRDRDLGSLGRLGDKFCSICRSGGYESLHAISPTNLLAMFGGSHETVNFCRHLRAMPPAKSSRRGIFGAFLVAATLHRRTVTSADSSPFSMIGASLVAATLHLRAMPHAKSSILDLTGASLMAVTLHIRAMPEAKSSILDKTGASLVTATLYPPAMSGTNSSPNGQFGASLTAAKFTHVFVIMVMSITMMWICEDEKISLDIDKGGGIVVGRRQSKKQ